MYSCILVLYDFLNLCKSSSLNLCINYMDLKKFIKNSLQILIYKKQRPSKQILMIAKCRVCGFLVLCPFCSTDYSSVWQSWHCSIIKNTHQRSYQIFKKKCNYYPPIYHIERVQKYPLDTDIIIRHSVINKNFGYSDSLCIDASIPWDD